MDSVSELLKRPSTLVLEDLLVLQSKSRTAAEIACAVVPKLLERLQISTLGMREKLRNYRCSEKSNTAGVVTGKAHHPLVLLKTPTLSPALDYRGHSG